MPIGPPLSTTTKAPTSLRAISSIAAETVSSGRIVHTTWPFLSRMCRTIVMVYPQRLAAEPEDLSRCIVLAPRKAGLAYWLRAPQRTPWLYRLPPVRRPFFWPRSLVSILARVRCLARLGALVRTVGKAWVGHRVAGARHRGDRQLAGQIRLDRYPVWNIGFARHDKVPPFFFSQRERVAIVPP